MQANKPKYWIAMAVGCGLSAQTPKLQFEVATVSLADPDRDLNLEERPAPSPIRAGATRVAYVATSVQLLVTEIRQGLGVASGFGPSVLGRVADKTGLTGKYDFTLEFAGSRSSFGFTPNPDTASDPAPDILEALEKQLGLKLVRSTAPQDILVIDHIETVPTEN